MDPIVCEGVRKRYGGTIAVHGADLQIKEHEIHALVGENGAGKSTLLGMISGRVVPDEGQVRIYDDVLTGGNPRDARDHGLAVVYQELTMVPAMDAAQNVFLGRSPSKLGLLDDAHMRARFQELCEEFEVDIPDEVPVSSLSVSQQQILEIMRGVEAESRVLMLDEPSAALAEHEREVLHRVVRQIRDRGTTIIFVSHNLEEVLLLADRITVLRDGHVVRTAAKSEWSRPSMIHAMVGREVEISRKTQEPKLGEVVLSVADVTLPGAIENMSAEVRKGEIVGLWGLVGSGRTSFMRSVAGLEPNSVGEMVWKGTRVEWPRDVRAGIQRGIALLPESRKEALVDVLSSSDNFWLGRHRLTTLLDKKGEEEGATDVVLDYGFDPARLPHPVSTLSGGNQQKVLLAKWAGRSPDVLMVDEPTRGIDVGAKSEILDKLVDLAAAGMSIIVTSSELEEVLAIADRLLVFSEGHIVAEVSSDDEDFELSKILHYGFREDVA